MSTDEQQQPNISADGASNRTLVPLTNAMVALYKEQFGRGPTKTRTYWSGPDVVSCFLEGTLTPAERNLARMGQHRLLRDMRLFFQYASIREFCEPVERITGRKVRSFHSSIDTKVDGLAVETFILYPQGEDGPSRIELAGTDDV